jgi:hypothetical protein
MFDLLEYFTGRIQMANTNSQSHPKEHWMLLEYSGRKILWIGTSYLFLQFSYAVPTVYTNHGTNAGDESSVRQSCMWNVAGIKRRHSHICTYWLSNVLYAADSRLYDRHPSLLTLISSIQMWSSPSRICFSSASSLRHPRSGHRCWQRTARGRSNMRYLVRRKG